MRLGFRAAGLPSQVRHCCCAGFRMADPPVLLDGCRKDASSRGADPLRSRCDLYVLLSRTLRWIDLLNCVCRKRKRLRLSTTVLALAEPQPSFLSIKASTCATAVRSISHDTDG
jgi:hypothetical protein